MKRIFISNLALVMGLNLLIKPLFIFGIDREVQNAVGASEYGLYFALFNFVYLFQIFNDFGIQNFNHSVFSKSEDLIPKYVPKILGTKMLLALLFASSVLLSAVIMGYSDFIWPLITIILCNMILAALLMYLRSVFSALGLYHLDSILSVADKTIMILGIGYLLWLQDSIEISVILFVVFQTISFLIAIGIALILLRRCTEVKVWKIQMSRPFSLALLRKSFPYAIVLFLMSLYTRIDAVMIERLLQDGKYEAGVYAASYRILDAFGMIGVLFAGLLLPMFAKLIKKKDDFALTQLISTAGNVLLIVAIVIVSISWIFHTPIMELLYDDATIYWAEVYQVLLVSYLGIAISYIYGTLLTAHESLWPMNKIFVASFLLNVILNFLLIPLWHAWGAALSTVVTQVGTGVALTIIAYKRIHISPVYLDWVKILFFCALTFLLCVLIGRLRINFPSQLVLVSLASAVIAFALGLVKLDWLWLEDGGAHD